jgi:beta-lactam-binding protein with PASTA domain
VGLGRRALTALGKVGVVLAVLIAFSFGLLGTIYLSLRTAEVKVPDVLGKDRFTAETMLDGAGLKIRVRGARASAEKPDTILSQLPEAGQIVKAGIPVAVEVSRAPKEGETVRSIATEPSQETEKPADNANQSSKAANENQNQNKPPTKNKNTNKNASNKNANNSNNANANRNANNRNANTTRNTSNGNRNANSTPNANRTNNSNTIRRPPIATPPFNPAANRGTP